jgi:hypothetical protein
VFGTTYQRLLAATPAALSKLPDETLVAGVHRYHRAVTVRESDREVSALVLWQTIRSVGARLLTNPEKK